MKWKVDLTECISFVRPKFKKVILMTQIQIHSLSQEFLKYIALNYVSQTFSSLNITQLPQMRQVSLSFSTHTITKTLHKKIWMKNICICQLSSNNVIRDAKKWLLFCLRKETNYKLLSILKTFFGERSEGFNLNPSGFVYF